MELTLAFRSPTSISLHWLPPNDDNCSFSYVVNSSNGSSVTDQYRTNTTSLNVTDLSVATMYHFAVAVEDANLTTGPWSEAMDLLWDGQSIEASHMYTVSKISLLFNAVPQVILNVSLAIKMNVVEVNWNKVQL